MERFTSSCPYCGQANLSGEDARKWCGCFGGVKYRKILSALEAVGGHPAFGFNYDPSHLGYQGVDYVKFIRLFGDRIFHVHMKDAWWGHGDGTVGVFGGHVDFGDARRYWDFRSLGRGDVNFEEIIVALNDVGYRGPLSVEWEDSRMDRLHGAKEALAFVRKLDFAPSAIAFDGAFGQ
jgi:sugar phosphate isomerase/epimerase